MKTLATGRSLIPHPGFPANAVDAISCAVVYKGAGDWAIDFTVAAPASRLRLPTPAVPKRSAGLWEATCFELFLLADDGRYFEFNFSPSGRWGAYQFNGYRDGMRPLEIARPIILTADPAQFSASMALRLIEIGVEPGLARTMAADSDTGQVDVEERPFVLSAVMEDLRLTRPCVALGLSAVIEEADGTRSYWALAHPPGQPDFHHPDCFALQLPAAEQS